MKTTPVLLLLLALFSCKKENTSPDPNTTQTWKSIMADFPKEIKVITPENIFGAAHNTTYSLHFDDVRNYLELNEISDGTNSYKRLRIRNEYNSEGYLIQHSYSYRGFIEPKTVQIRRDEDNKIRWVLSSMVSGYTDTIYYSYQVTGEETKVRSVLTPYPLQDPLSPSNKYDTGYVHLDNNNNLIKGYAHNQDGDEVMHYEETFLYNSNNSISKINATFIRYHVGEYPAQYTDSSFYSYDFKYLNTSYNPALPESFNKLACGQDYYIVLNDPNYLYTTSIMFMVSDSNPIIPYIYHDVIMSRFRPSEFLFYDSHSIPQQKPIKLLYTDDEQGNLIKLQILEDGSEVIRYEFKY